MLTLYPLPHKWRLERWERLGDQWFGDGFVKTTGSDLHSSQHEALSGSDGFDG